MSSRKYIATQLHNALEFAPDDDVLQEAAKLPHYVIDDRLMEVMAREDIQKTVLAMIEAKMTRLPFPALVIEFEQAPGVRRFVVLRENVLRDGFEATTATLGKDALFSQLRPMLIQLTGIGLEVVEATSEIDGEAAALATAIALMMLNTAGIDKEVITAKPLNKIRQRAGRPTIPHHTVMHIGSVVDRDGAVHRYGAGGKVMPIHLRHGHVRHQAKGPGRAERELIYIHPVLVNYRPGVEVPQPKRILTR